MKQRGMHIALAWVALLGLGATAEDNAKIRAKAKQITWSVLEGLNHETGALSEPVKKLVDKTVKIRGYALPLEASGDGVSSIFLVSDPMFCAHVPPPPPNQLLLVEFKDPLPWQVFEQSLWLTGTLRVTKQESEVTAFGYQVTDVAGLEKGGW